MRTLFENISKKIKGLAIGIFVTEAVAALIYGFELIWKGSDYSVVYGFLVIIAGFLVALITGWILYGYGELIEKADRIEKNTRKSGGESASEQKNSKLEALKAQGLITEEEYQAAVIK